MSWLSELFGGGGGDPGEAGAASARLADVQRRTEDIAQERLRQANEENRRYIDRINEENRQRLEDEQRNAMMQQVLKQFEPTPEQQRIQTLEDQARERELQREELRRGTTAQVAGLFGPEFERGYVPETLDDPYIQQAYTAQRAKADEFLNNLLKRNVITQTGYEGGQRNLEEQAPRVREQLSGIGQTLLEQERAGLRDVAGRAREAASTVDIGQTFDPSAFTTEAQTRAGEFGKSLSDKFASQIPGDLFDVSGLPDIAGAAQFAQNLTPTGYVPPGEEERQKPVQKRTSTVF